MIVDSLKKSILRQAFQGNLSIRKKSDSNIKENIKNILKIKEEKIKNKIYKETTKGKEISDNDKQYQIPSTWEWVRLIDLCSVITCGYASTPQYVSNGMPFLSAKNVKPFEFKPNDYKLIDKELYEKLTATCKPEINDILLTRVGAGIGESAIIDVKMDFAIYVSLTLIKLVDYNLINNKYILYWLNSPYGIRTSINNITGKKSSQGNLNVHDVRNFLIPLPPIEEQHRIVDKIEELFAKLDEIKPIEDELEMMKSTFPDNMRKSILNDCFSGTANFINEDYENWESDLIIKIADIYTGNSIPESVKKNKYANTEIGYNYIATKDLLFNHTFNYNNGIKIPYSEKGFKYASKNDILMCIEGGSAGKKIGILDEKVCYGNKLCKFSIKTDSVLPKFLYYYLQSNVFLKNFYENLNGIIGGVSVNKIKKIIVKYPSISEQKLIVEKIEQLLSICDDIDNIVRN